MKADKGVQPEVSQIKTDEICENTSDNIISITESKAKLVYREYMGSTTKGAIFSNLGLAVAFATPIITSDFKGVWGLSADLIKALFVFASIVFIIRFICSATIFMGKDRFLSEDNFIRELKGQERENLIKKREKLNKRIEAIRKQALREGYLLGKKRR